MINLIHPELGEKVDSATQIVAESLHNHIKVVCLNGLELVESRSIKFQYENEGNKVYYITQNAYVKLLSKFNIQYKSYFD